MKTLRLLSAIIAVLLPGFALAQSPDVQKLLEDYVFTVEGVAVTPVPVIPIAGSVTLLDSSVFQAYRLPYTVKVDGHELPARVGMQCYAGNACIMVDPADQSVTYLTRRTVIAGLTAVIVLRATVFKPKHPASDPPPAQAPASPSLPPINNQVQFLPPPPLPG
ncbi:MAG TPA: hypothetical protein VF803_00635 [Candidatus Paceibacterota bacterium]